MIMRHVTDALFTAIDAATENCVGSYPSSTMTPLTIAQAATGKCVGAVLPPTPRSCRVSTLVDISDVTSSAMRSISFRETASGIRPSAVSVVVAVVAVSEHCLHVRAFSLSLSPALSPPPRSIRRLHPRFC